MQDGWITAGFNALNQPVQMLNPQYSGGLWMWFGYDPLGRCVKRWKSTTAAWTPGYDPATYYYYDGWNLIQEGASGPLPDRVYVHGGRTDEIVASWGSGLWSYHQYDAQGNCIMLTDPSGAIREQYDYDAFGRPYVYSAGGSSLGSSSMYGNRFLFTGREWIKEMKVYDYRNRMYHPELGRFLQPDPIGFVTGDYNLYRYCHNDPVNKSDPTGLVELISKDFQWEMAKQGDSAINSQGSFFENLNRGHDHTSVGTNKVADGNYNDPNIEHHFRDQDEAGDTAFTMGNVESGTARPTLNWWVQKGHRDEKVILGELEHVSRHLWSAESGDVATAIRKFNANPNAPDAKKKLENARQIEKNWHRANLHGRPNRHAMDKNPKLWEKMTPTAIQNAIRNVTPMEDPRPIYLGY